MGVFSDWANRYYETGLNIIPVNGKRAFTNDWQSYCKSRLPEEQLLKWEDAYRDCNIGMPLGPHAGIVAFDLDYLFDREYDPKLNITEAQFNEWKKIVESEQEQIKAKIISRLPPTPCVKIGKDGKWCYFYRPKGSFQTTQVDRNGIRLFDILWDGKQTVLPPSIHPETGKPYRWTNGDLLKHLDELPELDWQLVLDIKAEFEKTLDAKIGNGKTISGRNDILRNAAFGMFMRGMTAEIAVPHLLQLDQQKNSPPLFSDKSEFKSLASEPEKAALKFSKSNYKSYLDRMQTEPPEKNKAKPKHENKRKEKNKKIGISLADMGINLSDWKIDDCGNYYQQIQFYRKYLVIKTTGISFKMIPQYQLMAKSIFENKNMCFDDKEYLEFTGKYWKWMQKLRLNNYIQTNNADAFHPSHLDNFVKAIKATCFKDALGVMEPEAMINVGNGVIDVKGGKLIPHNYKYMFKCCADVDYVEGAKCPAWIKFLKEVFQDNEDLISLSQRLFGYIIIGGKPFLHRAFVLFGSGRNGKSTFLDVLRAVVGHESYSVVSMSKLDKEFSIVNIDGKLANIVEETPSDEINAEIFKTLVGGGEVQAAHKGFDEYTFRCNARFVFACNEMPVFKDKTIGLEDRLVFIPFNRYFKEADRDTQITEKLLAELPGILNWAVEGAKLIMKERKIEACKVTTDAKEEYRKETDALYAWFCEEIEMSKFSPEMSLREVFECYKLDCDQNGNRPYSKDKFAKRFRKIVGDKCSELGFEYDPDLKDSTRTHRVFNCFLLKRPVTARTAKDKKVSHEKSNVYF